MTTDRHDDSVWHGFTQAIVRLDLPSGCHTLYPEPVGRCGHFPFDRPVHIITAYNPNGEIASDAANRRHAERLSAAVADLATHATVGSAPDGSYPEPGYAILDIDLESALDLGRRFGQRAIYAWSATSLDVVGVDDGSCHRMGWRLDPSDP